MLVAESQLQLDPRTRSCLGLDSWLKRPFELARDSYKLFLIVRNVPSAFFFSEALAMNDERQGALYARDAAFPRDISFQLDNGEQMWAASVGCNRWH